MNLNLTTPRSLYRDARLNDTDRLVFITAVEEGLLDLLEYREIKLSVLQSLLPVRVGREPLSRSVVCRSLERLVRCEYLVREEGDARAPKKYRVRLSTMAR